MQIKIKKHASRVLEAIDLCKLATRNHDFASAKKTLIERYNFETFDIASMMDQRVEICQQFQLFFANQTSSFQHFFKCRSSDFYLCDLLVELPYFQTEKRKCRFVYDEELNRSEVFTNAFNVLELMDETYPQNVHNFEELSLLIEKIDLDKEDKWLIQSTYLHLKEEMKQFVLLVNQVVDWLAQYEQVMCDEEELFYDYWSKTINTINMTEHLSQKLNIDISSKTNTIWLIPAFFNCQGIRSKNQKDSIQIYMGMIFDQYFSFEKKYKTPELICGQLKLLSDPSKFEILCTIKQRPHYGSELAKIFNLSTPTISHHMRSLENAGFIKIEKKDNKSFYSLDKEKLSLFLKQVEILLIQKEEE